MRNAFPLHVVERYTFVFARIMAGMSLIIFLLGLSFSLANPPVALAQQEPTPRPLYALPDSRSNAVFTSSSIALSDLTRTLVAVNMLSDSASIVAPVAGDLVQEISVGDDPRSVAITADGVRALVTNRGDDTLSVIDLSLADVTQTIELGGLWPYGVVTSDNQRAYVSMQGSDEVVIVDLVEGRVAQRIPTPAVPTALALWGDFLYVTHLWSGDVSLIYLPQMEVVNVTSTGRDTGMSTSIDIDITRGLAYLPQSRSYVDNPNPTFDTIVFPVVNVLQLNGFSLMRQNRITPDTADRPVNMPFAIEVDPFRRWVYVANAGSNDVSVIETETGRAIANIEVGANPRGLLLNGDRTRLYVHNALDGTLTIVETQTQQVLDDIPISTELTIPIDVLIGAELFHSAVDPRMSEDRWVSCANCHLDGLSDGRVWRGFPSGARNTPTLFNLQETAPYNWSGNWDEIADVELKVRSLQAGDGLIEEGVNDPLGDPHTGVSLDLDTLVIYLDTLQGPTNNIHEFDPELVERGREVFEQQGCGTCHALPTGTDLQMHDVGTGGVFDTPTVRWLWLTAPYYHDGSAATLQDVFRSTRSEEHQLAMVAPPVDIDALIAYLLTLPEEEVLTD